ncbi:MAG: phytanoyl-CoA dioxygenase family protein [Marivibrio sp.]|uniref:phytanoyl-CoA dioxygenase family protein n=1 Tax=Marivibrio sp. TaxID=2039719 RepID=UPI0032EDC781
MADATLKDRFFKDGFATDLDILSAEEVATQTAALDRAEARWGGSLHYVLKPHLLYPEAAAMVRHPKLLDAVTAILGPDVLAYESSFIIKEPQTESFVSWHQDLTYWGLDTDEVLTAWIALSPVTVENGCMRMVPGSHKQGKRAHVDAAAGANILSRGQTVADVAEEAAADLVLAPGEASLHHGWTLHASQPNRSAGRRIGFSVIFITPRVQQTVSGRESAVLVRGRDAYGFYETEPTAERFFDPEMVALQAELDARRKALWETA